MATLQKDIRSKDAKHKGDHLHIRASQRDKQTLTRAARLRHMTISQFLLQLALPVAEEILKTEEAELGNVQTVFALKDEAWQEFNRLLDAPPRDLPELQKLLLSKPVWES